MGALATGIAHEVSTPLGVIMGRAEQLLPKVAGDDRAKRALDVILEQAERIGQVVRGFLRLARGGTPSLERTEPAVLAKKAIELVAHRFEKARVTLTSEVAPNVPMVACEPRLFEQALVNLLLNACDACAPEGNVELRVQGDEARVAFVVVDDGAGIAPEDVARATEPFFTTKPPGEGSGLGLAIATEIAKHHHGKLTLGPRATSGARASTPPGERGTRACIEIPSARDAS
jgi:signal transduction histidine kinase